jgi:hypothetical protein
MGVPTDNEQVRITVDYIREFILMAPGHYLWTYNDDVLTETQFNDPTRSIWADPGETMTWSQILMHFDSAWARHLYYNDPLEIWEMKDQFAELHAIKSSKANFSSATSAPAHGVGNSSGGAATNATANLTTDYDLISGLLGVANGLNAANTAQNSLATKYNDLATKYNDLSTKFNSLLTWATSAKDSINALKSAGAT